jgi:hypothetical protein
MQSPLMAETSCLISDVQVPDIGGIQLQDRLADLGLGIPAIFTTMPSARGCSRVEPSASSLSHSTRNRLLNALTMLSTGAAQRFAGD